MPHLSRRPILLVAWVLVGIFLVAALGAWSIRVPTYVAARGIVLDTKHVPQRLGGVTAAVLFVAPERSNDVSVGQRVKLKINGLDRYVEASIATVEPGLVGPVQAHSKYGLDRASPPLSGPSRAAIAVLADARSSDLRGSRFSARVRVGAERLLGLISGFDS